MTNGGNSQSGGVGFVGLLTVAFVVLKLTGHLDWSWWWVLSPLWISALAATIALMTLAVVIATIDRYR